MRIFAKNISIIPMCYSLRKITQMQQIGTPILQSRKIILKANNTTLLWMNFQFKKSHDVNNHQVQMNVISGRASGLLSNTFHQHQSIQQPGAKTRQMQEHQLNMNLNPWKKIVIILPIIAAYTLYRLFYTKYTQPQCIKDTLHNITTSLNEIMRTNKVFASAMMIAAQQAIDIQIVLFSLMFFVRIQTFIIPVIIGIFYLIRGVIFLNLQKLPYPLNIVWPQPFIPSIGVPYGISRDFFYSGHTGFMLIFTINYFGIYKYHPKLILFKYLRWINLVCLFQVMLVLIITRVHYTIDIIAAWLFVAEIYWSCFRYRIKIDRAFSFVLFGVGKIITWIYNQLKNFYSDNNDDNVNVNQSLVQSQNRDKSYNKMHN